MIKIYLYLNNEWKQQRIEIDPNNTPTLDETLETFSFVLLCNDKANPYYPMTKVKVEFDENESTIFDLITDSVEPFSLNPILYKHSITCIQNTRKLSKFMVRNSVFSQPANQFRSSNFGVVETINASKQLISISNFTTLLSYQAVSLSNKEKIKNSYIELSLDIVIPNPDTNVGNYVWAQKFHTLDEINEYFGTNLTINNLCLYYNDEQGNHVITLTPQDLGLTQWEFNRKVLIKTDFINQQYALGRKGLFIGTERVDPQYPTSGAGKIFLEGQFDVQATDYIAFAMFNVKLTIETYYYTAYDVLNLLIERQKRDSLGNTHQPLFSLPTREQNEELYDLLTKTITPNLTFTQETMFDCVAEVFKLFDATLTLDENDVLGIEYFNDLRKEEITPKLTGINLTINEEKYNNGLISNYQDGYVKTSFPSAENKYAPARSSNFGVPANDDHFFIVPFPIKQIDSFKVIVGQINVPCWQTGSNVPISVINDFELDISFFVVEQSLWTELDVNATVTNANKLIQANTLFFSSGDNKIALGTLKQNYIGQVYAILWNTMLCALYRHCCIGLNSSASIEIESPGSEQWKDVRGRLTYFSSVDGRLQVESLTNKYEGTMMIDQANGSTDLNKLGLNILGTSLKLGEPTFNATHKISSWARRIKAGQIYRDGNDLWVANVVNYSFLDKNYLLGKVSFVKNFNGLALRTRVAREKRMSNISNALVVKSEDNIIDYVYYSTGNVFSYDNGYIERDLLVEAIYQSLTIDYESNLQKIDYAYFTRKTPTPEASEIETVYMPLYCYGAGNMICFEMSFDSPISAGNQTTAGESGWWGSDKYFTKAAKYTDANGFVDNIDLCLIQDNSSNITFNNDFPAITPPAAETVIFKIEELVVKKQPNEIFALNYELAFISNNPNETFLGSEFINNNFFTNGKPVDRKLSLVLLNEKLSIVDNVLLEADWHYKADITNIAKGSGYLRIYNDLIPANINKNCSWAIIDQDNNLIYGSNAQYKDVSLDNSVYLYIAVRHTRR